MKNPQAIAATNEPTNLTPAIVTAIIAQLQHGRFPNVVAWAQACRAPSTAEHFASELIFVICNSGMQNKVAQTIYERVMVRLHANLPTDEPVGQQKPAFRHPGKVGAIRRLWRDRRAMFAGWQRCAGDGERLEYLASLPWIGGITRFPRRPQLRRRLREAGRPPTAARRPPSHNARRPLPALGGGARPADRDARRRPLVRVRRGHHRLEDRTRGPLTRRWANAQAAHPCPPRPLRASPAPPLPHGSGLLPSRRSGGGLPAPAASPAEDARPRDVRNRSHDRRAMCHGPSTRKRHIMPHKRGRPHPREPSTPYQSVPMETLTMRRPFVLFAVAFLAIAALVALPHPVLANNAQSADLSQMFSSAGGSANSFFNWTTLRNFLTTTFAQIIIALLILGAVWRLRENFEWGSAGTTIALIVLALGCVMLLPTLSNLTSGALVP